MSDHAAPHADPAAPPHGGAAHHGDSHYVKVWGILLALLVVSVLGPMLEIQILTMITAFGIALIKAYLVIKNFMHLPLERKWVAWILVTMLLFMAVFVGGVAPDVYKHDGQRWENVAAKHAVEKGLKAAAEHPDGHGAPGHAPAGEHAPAPAPAHH